MGKVISNMSMSLDGIVNAQADGVTSLFQWIMNGEVYANSANPNIPIKTSPEDAAYFNEQIASIGAVIAGRRVFDEAHGWGGTHPVGAPVIILTHATPEGWPRKDSSIEFTDGSIEQAVRRAKQLAGNKHVAVATPSIVKQCLEVGLLDEISIDLVPVLLGKGLHYFEQLQAMNVALGTPTIIQGSGVTHLRFEVIK